MHLLALAIVMVATEVAAQQPSCDFVSEHEYPNCHFTARSNHGLHGPVHTARVNTRELSPDPRTRNLNAHEAPRLPIQEPVTSVAFSPDGDCAARMVTRARHVAKS
jgi:hypothetical protein